MADADYGYVGKGGGKIALYRGREVVKESIAQEHGVSELIALLRSDGKWADPPEGRTDEEQRLAPRPASAGLGRGTSAAAIPLTVIDRA